MIIIHTINFVVNVHGKGNWNFKKIRKILVTVPEIHKSSPKNTIIQEMVQMRLEHNLKPLKFI